MITNRVASRLLAAAAVFSTSAAFAQTQPQQDEVRAVVAEMLADAQTRSSLLAGGEAGHDGAFYLASPDGSFRLNIGGMVQARYMMNFRDDASAVGTRAGDDFVTGFQMRHTELNFQGNIHKDWLYFVEGEFDQDGGVFNMNDAYIGYKFNDHWVGLLGQIKAHVLREENINERYQLTADRSITNSVFSQGRSQAVAAVYTDENFQFIPVFSDGAATEDTDFGSANQSDWALTGRINWKFAGDWKQFNAFSSPQKSPFAGMLGAAVHYQGSANTNNPSDTDVKVLLYTIDAQLEGDGWNFFAAFIGRDIELRSGGADTNFDDFGVVAQGGIFVTDKDELFGRYDVVIPDDSRSNTGSTGTADPFNTLTFGVNHYFAGHAAKFTGDIQWALNKMTETALVAPNSGLGYLGSDKDNEVTLRFQFQLLF